MENVFRVEFYPTEVDINEIWKDSLIVFDTCSLLNLYRYSSDTRGQYLSVMKQVKERLWLPYHVGDEYFKNRIEVILSLEDSYKKVQKKINGFCEEIEKLINDEFKKKEDDVQSLIDDIKVVVEKMRELISDNQKKRLPFSHGTDPILADLKNFYAEKIGEDFTEVKHEELKKEGKTRFEKNIPPGYCDRKKSDNKKSDSKKDDNTKDDIDKNEYGDLIIWKQIIEKSCADKKNVIFVTDDRKEDWWLIIHGRKISPRKELYSEFLRETGQKILIYSPDDFFKYAKEQLKFDMDEKAIKEIVDVSVSYQVEDKQPSDLKPEWLDSLSNVQRSLGNLYKELGLDISSVPKELTTYEINPISNNRYEYLNRAVRESYPYIPINKVLDSQK